MNPTKPAQVVEHFKEAIAEIEGSVNRVDFKGKIDSLLRVNNIPPFRGDRKGTVVEKGGCLNPASLKYAWKSIPHVLDIGYGVHEIFLSIRFDFQNEFGEVCIRVPCKIGRTVRARRCFC